MAKRGLPLLLVAVVFLQSISALFLPEVARAAVTIDLNQNVDFSQPFPLSTTNGTSYSGRTVQGVSGSEMPTSPKATGSGGRVSISWTAADPILTVNNYRYVDSQSQKIPITLNCKLAGYDIAVFNPAPTLTTAVPNAANDAPIGTQAEATVDPSIYKNLTGSNTVAQYYKIFARYACTSPQSDTIGTFDETWKTIFTISRLLTVSLDSTGKVVKSDATDQSQSETDNTNNNVIVPGGIKDDADCATATWILSPFIKMACSAGDALQGVMAGAMQWALGLAVNQIPVAKDISFASSSSPSALQWAKTLYDMALNLVNYLIVLVLLFLSFVNILHINIDTYAIKKIMPTIIVGVILANFSLLITRFVIDSSEVLTAALIGNDVGTFTLNFVNAFGGKIFQNAVGGGGFVLFIVALFSFPGVSAPIAVGLLTIMLIPFGIMLVLLLLFYLRYYVLVMLAALSPLAFAALATPMTQQYFKQWWSNLLKWTFMAPIAFFFLNIAGEVGKASGSESWSAMAVATLMAYLAITTPWKMGGAVASTWNGVLKKSGAYLGKTADKTLGDVQEGLGYTRATPITFIKGWKERTDEQYHRHENVGKASGKAFKEATSRGVANFLKTGNLRSITQAHNQMLNNSRNQAHVEELLKIGQVGANNTDGVRARNDLQVAIQSGNYEAARNLALQAVAGGHMQQGLWEEFNTEFRDNPAAQAERPDFLAAMARSNRDRPNPGFVVYTDDTQDDRGRTVSRSSIDTHADQQAAERALETRLNSLRPEQRALELDRLAQQNLVDQATNEVHGIEQMNTGFRRALIRQIHDNQAAILAHRPGGAANRVRNRFDPSSLQTDFGANIGVVTDNQAQRAVLRAGSFQGANIQFRPTAEYVQQAQAVNTNWGQIETLMQQEYERLRQEIITNTAGTAGGSVDLGAYVPGQSIRQQVDAFQRANPNLMENINADGNARTAFGTLQSTGMAHADLMHMNQDYASRHNTAEWQTAARYAARPRTP